MADKDNLDKSNAQKIKEFTTHAKSKGYSDDKIMHMFKEKGWKEEDIKKLTSEYGKIVERTKETYVIQKPANTYYIEHPIQTEVIVKRKFNLIPYEIRFPLVWTIFFMIIGITIQSLQAGKFVFLEFFSKNYYSWIMSLGSFASPTLYNSPEAFTLLLFSNWYYFFFSGGIIALVWSLLVVLLYHGED